MLILVVRKETARLQMVKGWHLFVILERQRGSTDRHIQLISLTGFLLVTCFGIWKSHYQKIQNIHKGFVNYMGCI
jgi:ABC-type transport system involved in cytochrome c biogenesis permease subunit